MQDKNSKLFRNIIIFFFLLTPIISSIISTIHLIDFFKLGNSYWLSVLLSTVFEIGSIASFLSLSILNKIKQLPIWIVFIILTSLQMMGNIYYTYNYIYTKLTIDPNYLKSLMDILSFFIDMEDKGIKFSSFLLSIMIGIPIPLISLSFLKSTVDYIKIPDNKPIMSNTNDNNEKIINEVDSSEENTDIKKENINNDYFLDGRTIKKKE